MTLLVILTLTLLGSALSVGAASLFLLVPDRLRVKAIPALICFATGTLLGAATLGLLPRALSQAAPLPVMAMFLAGLLTFFIVEKAVIWRHCHNQDCTVHSRAASLILIGDATHNFMDGIAIATATVISLPLGVSTALAVTAHEVPQEVGDFGILLAGGLDRRRAFKLNLLSSLASVPGALIAFYFAQVLAGVIPYVMAFSAASFIYIAVADLIPASHSSLALKSSSLQVLLTLVGVAVIYLLIH
ncbi:MAG: ZIP family metal transporter [bacterium]|nr:ZIP family metal transporter [bacterium]